MEVITSELESGIVHTSVVIIALPLIIRDVMIVRVFPSGNLPLI